MIVTSAMAGTFVRVVRPTASSATAISLRALFLAPTTATSPTRWAPPTTRNRSLTHRTLSGRRPTDGPSGAGERVGPMVNLTRIYTRTGDDGTTSLGDFSRVSKNDARLHAYADSNEANAAIGIAVACGDLPDEVRATLQRVQNELFDVGADLSTPLRPAYDYPPLRVEQPWIDDLEADCDHYLEQVEKLRSFILPGGTAGSAHLHLATT